MSVTEEGPSVNVCVSVCGFCGIAICEVQILFMYVYAFV